MRTYTNYSRLDIIHIDRPSDYFEEILHYLQTGILRTTISESPRKQEAFENELNFYEIDIKKPQLKIEPKFVDQNLSVYKFKAKNTKNVYEIKKEQLQDFSDSILFTMVTTKVPVEMLGDVIVLDFEPDEVSLVFDFILFQKIAYKLIKYTYKDMVKILMHFV